MTNKVCKHQWHFIKEVYIDGWERICSQGQFKRGHYLKVACLLCGEVKLIEEKGKE